MLATIAVNAVLALIVFAAVITLIMRAIKAPRTHAVVAPQPQPARRDRRSGALVPARPWA
jgi:hypothetical protein